MNSFESVIRLHYRALNSTSDPEEPLDVQWLELFCNIVEDANVYEKYFNNTDCPGMFHDGVDLKYVCEHRAPTWMYAGNAKLKDKCDTRLSASLENMGTPRLTGGNSQQM